MHEVALKFQQTPYDQIVRAGMSIIISSQGALDNAAHLQWLQELTPELVDKTMAARGDFSRSFYKRIYQHLMEDKTTPPEVPPQLLKREFSSFLNIMSSEYDWIWLRQEELEETQPMMNMSYYTGPKEIRKLPIASMEDVPYDDLFDLQLSIDEQTTRDQIALPITSPMELVEDGSGKYLSYGAHMLLATPTTLGQLYRRGADSTVPVMFLIWRDGTLYAVVPVTGLEANVMIGNLSSTGTDFYRTEVPVEPNPTDIHQYVAVPVTDSTKFWCRPGRGHVPTHLTLTGSHPHVPGLVDELSEEHVRTIKFARMNRWYHNRDNPEKHTTPPAPTESTTSPTVIQ